MHLAQSPADLEPSEKHRALLFDWDGTLADSQLVNFKAIDGALAAAGLSIEKHWFEARTGVSTREMVAMLSVLQGIPVDVNAVAAHRDDAYLERVGEVGEVALVATVLRREHGSRATALATGGGARTVLATADSLGLRGFFDALVTREDVEEGKPAPDIFLRAASLLGAPAEACLVYEDSDEGIAAARTAGMDVIDVRPLRRLNSASQ
nr:HAD-IA family hydrolase [Frondihabitans sp. VKM Ac-2883]